ncbi:glycosyltransferase family 61 protein [Salipiger bermudensis]|uniref:glycosyltransferase family 61 protein n=1 Tax=Salipiger bermudensis TaxID=344736 RepID=UPI0035169270
MQGSKQPVPAHAHSGEADADELIALDEAARLSASRRVLAPYEHTDLRAVFPHHEHLYDPKLQVLEFRDCFINRHGFVKLSNGQIISDLGYREMLDRSVEELKNVALGDTNVERLAEPTILVSGHKNYYHWHLNWLPRLALADMFEDLRGIKPIIPASPTTFMRDSMKMVTGRSSRDVISQGWKVLYAERVFVPTMFTNPVHAPFALRQYQPQRRLRPADGRGRKIYISRAEAPLRRILNESEVMAILAPFGFEKVVSENLSYKEQVALFSETDFIIGAHGAGLTNMLFCSPGFSVIELLNQYFTRVYWSLSQALGSEHYKNLQSDRLITPEHETNATQARKNADFFVDTAKLRVLVEDILATPRSG